MVRESFNRLLPMAAQYNKGLLSDWPECVFYVAPDAQDSLLIWVSADVDVALMPRESDGEVMGVEVRLLNKAVWKELRERHRGDVRLNQLEWLVRGFMRWM